ncbi:hypothetical protein TYRP_023445 [Tyrophagus putrescentiae]|nr:hypothetical protein TYRP_023445 [Tyrophagus putrescentiae]
MESFTKGKKMLSLFCFFFLFCLLSLSPDHQVAGHCCPPAKTFIQCSQIFYQVLYCDDCYIGSPWCGSGPCNIFGCNCDGPCRGHQKG